jgi:ferredoxin
MTNTSPPADANLVRFLPTDRLQELLDQLTALGFDTIGPTVDQQAIVYRSVRNVSELPRGWTDSQQAGTYRLVRTENARYFGFNSSPESWKKYLFPPRQEMSHATLRDDGWHFEQPTADLPRFALLGVRACDLAAITIQDRVFTGGDYVDPGYQQRRCAALIIAVNCSTASGTCFCTSMDTGPRCRQDFDLALTEIDSGFVVESGSPAGAEILSRLTTEPITQIHQQLAEREIAVAEAAVRKQFDNHGVYELLTTQLEHPHWESVAQRCLSCTNCTMVCPTCFCSTVGDVADLQHTEVSRVRQWDSCFNIDFSYMAGGTVRNTIRSRYRQWLVHKLATWHDQFDTSGCTGCGRCITWCPVGIDLTEEVAALRHRSG